MNDVTPQQPAEAFDPNKRIHPSSPDRPETTTATRGAVTLVVKRSGAFVQKRSVVRTCAGGFFRRYNSWENQELERRTVFFVYFIRRFRSIRLHQFAYLLLRLVDAIEKKTYRRFFRLVVISPLFTESIIVVIAAIHRRYSVSCVR